MSAAGREVDTRELFAGGEGVGVRGVRVHADVRRQLLLHQQRRVLQSLQRVATLVTHLQLDDVVALVQL